MIGRRRSPGLGAVALIALLATAAGLALASAVLTSPVAFDQRDAPILVAVALVQALAWWWSRRRERGLGRAALRLAAQHKSLTLWLAADVAALAVLWSQETARWSRTAPAWDTVAAYVAVRAALLALFVLARTRRSAGREGLPGRTVAARAARWVWIGAALAAPAWTHLIAAWAVWAAWQCAVVGGLLALLALAFWASPGAARETWVGLAGLAASPAWALGGCALVLASPVLPLAAPLALSALLPALGLATLATPAVIEAPLARETPMTREVPEALSASDTLDAP